MGRILIIAASLVLPFIVYGLWNTLTRRKLRLQAEGRLPAWQALPWTWLIVAGILTCGVTLVAFNLLGIDPDLGIGGESLIKREGAP